MKEEAGQTHDLKGLDDLLAGMASVLVREAQAQSKERRFGLRWLAPLVAVAAGVLFVFARQPEPLPLHPTPLSALEVESPRPFVVYPASSDLMVIWLLDSE